MKTLIAVLVVLFMVLQYKLWFADGGFIDVIHQKHQITEQTKKNQALDQRNAILSASIKTMQKQNKNVLENQARGDLGMIKQGETYFQVVK